MIKYKHTIFLLSSFVLLMLSACSSTVVYSNNISPKQEKKQETKQNTNYNGYEDMVASFYGEDYHGKMTANGEIFDMNAMTCAHKTLPFGTLLLVLNPDTQQSVEVTVNDRGPFIEGRDLDLSKAAAEKIGLLSEGVKTVKVKIIK